MQAYSRYLLFKFDRFFSFCFSSLVVWIKFNKLSAFLIKQVLIKLPYYSHSYIQLSIAKGTCKKEKTSLTAYIRKNLDCLKSQNQIAETMRCALLIPDTLLAQEILDLGAKKNLINAEFEGKRLFLATKKMKPYMASYKFSPKKKWIRKNFPEKYVALDDVDKVLRSEAKIAIITTLGPGDELFFSYIYRGLIGDNTVNHSKLKVICDHRYYEIFCRSYPELTFIPTKRSRYINHNNPYILYSELPHYNMHKLLCNSSLKEILDCDKFIFSFDILERYFSIILNNTGGQYIKPNPVTVEKFKQRLDPRKKYIGISWRSSVSDPYRDNYYFTIEDVGFLLEIKNIIFVNLQYDDCQAELEWAEKNYPGKLINFGDIDMYNDFDSVISLMECLDVVITPPTTVSELSANLGQKTVLLSNVLDAAGRKTEKGTDFFHPNMVHIVGDKIGDKESLIKNLKDYLEKNF